MLANLTEVCMDGKKVKIISQQQEYNIADLYDLGKQLQMTCTIYATQFPSPPDLMNSC